MTLHAMSKPIQLSRYATDGRCHNAEPGTFGHECGKPAEWVGVKANGFSAGFCNDCKQRGWEARHMSTWWRRADLPAAVQAGELSLPY